MAHPHSLSHKFLKDAASGIHLSDAGRIFLLLTILLSLVGGSQIGVQAASEITFPGEELLTRPTDTSIAINVIPDENVNIYYEYGTSSGGPYSATSTGSATAGEPYNVVISGLSHDTQYYYHMQYQKPGDVWVPRTEHSFHTQRAPGDTFRFVVTSDTHAGLGGNYFSTTNYSKTLSHILADHR